MKAKEMNKRKIECKRRRHINECGEVGWGGEGDNKEGVRKSEREREEET